jgi:hypothetical protein
MILHHDDDDAIGNDPHGRLHLFGLADEAKSGT